MFGFGVEQWGLLAVVTMILLAQLGFGRLARVMFIVAAVVMAITLLGAEDKVWGTLSFVGLFMTGFVIHSSHKGMKENARSENATEEKARGQLTEVVKKRDLIVREQDLVNAELEANHRLYQMSSNLGGVITMNEFHREVARLVRELLRPQEAVLMYLDTDKGAPHTFKVYDLLTGPLRSKPSLEATHPLWEHFKDPTGAGVISNTKTERGNEVVVFMSYKRRITGGLYIRDPEPPKTLAMDASSLLYTLAVQVNMALNKCMLYMEIERMSRRDVLTSIYKRWYFLELIEDEFLRVEAENRPLTLLMVDIDHFKDFNDTYGHLAGDKVLKTVASYLKEHIRVQDILCRYGGEEFVVALPDTPNDGAIVVAERLRAAIAERPAQVGGGVCTITISIGGATFPRDGKTVNELLEIADAEMYRSKEAGRNKVSFRGTEPAGPGLPEQPPEPPPDEDNP